jgi:GntR family transcriptional regulator / MocR family aminotransferase
LDQVVLAHFMAEGHFARHVRRMRSLYAARQVLLVEEGGRRLSGLLDVPPAGAGMHLVGRLPAAEDDREASPRAAELDVEAPHISLYGEPPDGRDGLMLGYAAAERPRSGKACAVSRRSWNRCQASGFGECKHEKYRA